MTGKEMYVKDFDLDQIFTCGQCFRWKKESDGSYTGVVGNKIYNINTFADDAGVKVCGAEGLENYLDLNTDYGEIKSFLSSKDDLVKEAIKVGNGIRILRQDYWETIVSFLISQNNNIPRITGCIEKLCQLLGEYLGTYDGPRGEHVGKKYYSIPTPERLAKATMEDLAPVRLGYRAPYLIQAGKTFLENKNTPLMEYLGVGPKVANCISLFGKHELDAFPIDVWVKRVMHELYGFDEEDKKGMENFAREKFSPYGGIAQQYLFYYIRERQVK